MADAPALFGSPVRRQVAFFTAVAITELILTALETSPPETLFPALLVLDLGLRLCRASAADAELWWPVPPTLFAATVFDNDKLGGAGSGVVLPWLKECIKGWAISFVAKSRWTAGRFMKAAMANPLLFVRRVRKLLRLMRWIVWGLPFIKLIWKMKIALKRHLILRAQRRTRAAKQQVYAKLREQEDLAQRQHNAVVRIQSAFRAKRARKRVSREREIAELRARCAARRICAAARRVLDAKGNAALDARPLLFRPDSGFLSLWKCWVLLALLAELLRMALAAEEGEKLSYEELLKLSVGSNCVDTPGPRRFLIGPRTTLPKPEYCDAGFFDSWNSTADTVLEALSAMLDASVGATAALDLFIEFFTGRISPSTGILGPKEPLERYVLPPYSLGFALLVNPAMHHLNAFVRVVILDLERVFRLIVWLQPVLYRIEKDGALRLRHFMRRHAVFQRSQQTTGGDKLLVVEKLFLPPPAPASRPRKSGRKRA